MDDTRTSLADKIEALEDQVTDTVKEATTDVTDTVKTVKETVEEVTDDVKEAVSDVTHSVADTVEDMAHNVASFFDVTGHVRRHPWPVFGGAIFAGFIVERLWPRRQSAAAPKRFQEPASLSSIASAADRMDAFGQAAAPAAAVEKPKPERATGWFWDELRRLQGLAVSSVFGLARDVAARHLPEAIGKKVSDEFNRVTTRLGGEPIEEPIDTTEKTPAPKPPDHNGRKQPAFSGFSG